MNFLGRVWVGFKYLLSGVLVLVAAVCIFGASVSGKLLDPMLFGVVGVCLFLAALPWISTERKPSRALGLICVILSLGVFSLALEAFVGALHFPEDCSTRYRKLGCYLFNEIYSLGGLRAVGYTWLFVSALLLAAAIAHFILSSRVPNNSLKSDVAKPRALG